jgi:hypothetical protein
MDKYNGELKPSEDIGKSNYDYLVDVYFEGEEVFIMGAKAYNDTLVTW